MAETIQTFTGGMDFDTEKALRSNSVTKLVENMRLVTNTNGNTGALECIKGNTQYAETPTTILYDRYLTSCLIRNWLVVFGKNGTNDVITKIQLGSNDEKITEVEVYSNPLFLKKDWKSLTNLRLDELTKKLNDFIEKGENKIYVQLTTYKFPLAYEKKGDWFHREYLWKRAVKSIRWRFKI